MATYLNYVQSTILQQSGKKWESIPMNRVDLNLGFTIEIIEDPLKRLERQSWNKHFRDRPWTVC